jgi:UDP-3-O-[3-hydroxymyristoyl] glucosamine N-acyltransferase
MGVRLSTVATLGELAAALGGEVDEPVRSREIREVCRPEDAEAPDQLVVLTSARHLAAARLATQPVLCPGELARRLPAGRRWAHSHVMWVVARLLTGTAEQEEIPAASAWVHPEADVAADAVIGPGAVVMKGAVIGPGARIGANSVIYGGVRLGVGVRVGPLAVLGRPGFGWTEAPDGARVRIPQRGGVVVEDHAEIGPLCSVDAGTLGPTRVGAGVKLDAQVHAGHNVQLGAGTLVAGQVGLAGSATIGERVLIGGQAGVTDHAHVGDEARIAAKSGVIGDIPPRAVVAGFPAVNRMRWLRALARLLQEAKRPRR